MRYLLPVLGITLMPTLMLSVSKPSIACSSLMSTNFAGVSALQKAIALSPQPEPPGRSIKRLPKAIAINPQPLPPRRS